MREIGPYFSSETAIDSLCTQRVRKISKNNAVKPVGSSLFEFLPLLSLK